MIDMVLSFYGQYKFINVQADISFKKKSPNNQSARRIILKIVTSGPTTEQSGVSR
jgi:hypothetical protein